MYKYCGRKGSATLFFHRSLVVYIHKLHLKLALVSSIYSEFLGILEFCLSSYWGMKPLFSQLNLALRLHSLFSEGSTLCDGNVEWSVLLKKEKRWSKCPECHSTQRCCLDVLFGLSVVDTHGSRDSFSFYFAEKLDAHVLNLSLNLLRCWLCIHCLWSSCYLG